jgi:O-antigen chain-terminating methyltransferase
LFAAQDIEHLQPDQLLRLVSAAFHKLRPGAPVVLETVNPACWFAFFESYLRDVTHVRPIHPDTMKFLLTAGGFQQVTIRWMAPYPEQGKLAPIAIPDRPVTGADPLLELAETFNANVDKLNGLIFTYLDYAAIAVRP